MRVHLLTALAAGLLLAANSPKDDAKNDVKKFAGTWTVASIERNGDKVDAEALKDAKIIFKGDQFTLRGAEGEMKGTITLDPSKKPPTITAKGTSSSGEEFTAYGIYELKGDTLKICYSTEGEDQRPKEFKTTAESSSTLAVYKRSKK